MILVQKQQKRNPDGKGFVKGMWLAPVVSARQVCWGSSPQGNGKGGDMIAGVYAYMSPRVWPRYVLFIVNAYWSAFLIVFSTDTV